MVNIIRDDKKEVYLVKGSAGLRSTIREGILLSRGKKSVIKFSFNGVVITVKSDSDGRLIYRDYLRALEGCIDPNIGPYPNPALSDEEQANDARVRAENKRS